jgi:type IVB pilus formation R64 PilN family outer membrane protein
METLLQDQAAFERSMPLPGGAGRPGAEGAPRFARGQARTPTASFRDPWVSGGSVLAVATAICTLAGCASPSIGERAQADHAIVSAAAGKVSSAPSLADQAGPGVRGGQLETDRRAAEQAGGVVLRRSGRAWIGGTSVPMGAGEQLPSVFFEPLQLNFDDGPSVRTMAERLTALSGVPVRVKADVMNDPAAAGTRVTPQGGAAVVSTTAVAPRESSVAAVPMKWSGSLQGYLNHVTDLTGLSWEYRDGVAVIERYRTEFFELAAFDGDTTYSMGMTGADAGTGGTGASNSGTSTSTASSDVSDKGKFNPIDSVIKTLKQIVKDVPGSEVVRAEGSGRVAVTTTKETMAKVRDFMRAENDALQRQAQIQFDIYAIRHSEGDQKGVDWEGVFQSLSKAFGVAVSSPATLASASSGQLSFSILNSATAAAGNSTARRFGDSKAILQLLSEFGTSTEHRPVSLLSLNRQWARKASLNSRAYVSETTPGVATTVGAGAPGLKTATVTTGDRYVAQPYIMDNGTVLLKFGIGVSSLVQIANFTSGAGTTQQTVQTPETNSAIDQAVVALKAGQVLAITGLSRVVTSDKRRTLTEEVPIGLGGSKTVDRVREDFVIFVRPTVL